MSVRVLTALKNEKKNDRVLTLMMSHLQMTLHNQVPTIKRKLYQPHYRVNLKLRKKQEYVKREKNIYQRLS